MLFGVLFLIGAFVPLQTSPEFVVREIQACCHHHVAFKCSNDFKIAIIQARYVVDVGEEERLAAVIDSSMTGPTSSSTDQVPDSDDIEYQHHPFIHPSRPSVSLWDLDVKFAHELQKQGIPRPYPVNTLPEWHPDHFSNTASRRRFYSRRGTLPPKFPKGSNFTGKKVLEMPLYEINFMDSGTIWRQPLFPVVQTESRETSSLLSSQHFPTMQTEHRHDSENKCLSYQTLMSASQHASVSPQQISSPGLDNDPKKPGWEYQDLRPFFNRRCSGKSECDVLLLENKGLDEDITHVCQLLPNGKIVVKYLCFNASSEITHSKCNKDVTAATEGFIMSPGYPELYPGEQKCQFRLHVPHQRILLIFFDISLRAQDKKRCRDELSVEANQYKLLSTCGDEGSAIVVFSESHQLNVTLTTQSRLAFPKRGFLSYYRVIGCVNPHLPQNSYLTVRNATMAEIVCDVGHVFPDTLSRTRWLYCSPLDHRWLGTFPFCSDIRRMVGRNASIDAILRNDPSVWSVRERTRLIEQFYFAEIALPIIVMLFIFLLHGFLLYLIWRQRSRLEEIENQTNQEMERICASHSVEGGSIFSFPDSMAETLWDHDEDELEFEETDQDRTLTLTTLTLQTDTPTSSAARKITDLSEERSGLFRFYQNGTSSTSTSHNNSNGHNDHGQNSRPHIGYVHGQLLPVTFNGYFRQTSV